MATPVGDAIPVPGDARIDSLVQGGQWQSGGGPLVLTYSFSIETELGYQWSAALKSVVQLAFAEFSAVANITFEEIAPGSNVDFSPADLALALEGNRLEGLIGALAIGFFPDPDAAAILLEILGDDPADYPNPEGDVYFDHFKPPFSALGPGGSAREVALHEIGHALGLKHPFDFGLNDRPTANLDSSLSVMTSGALESPLGSGHAVTPLLYDILAIQHIYGANMSYRTGDDTYVLGADGTERAIWDAGGNDTFDLSGAANGVVFALEEGTIVELGGNARAAIAFGVDIENVIGTPFSDFITGNALDNLLEGGGGNDILDGDAGADRLVFTKAVTGVAVNFATFTAQDGTDRNGAVAGIQPGTDTFSDIEFIVGTGFNDGFTVSTGDEEFDGAGGSDTVLADFTHSLADDPAQSIENLTLIGTGDIDATGDGAPNVLTGNSGNNVLDGGAGGDTLIGGAGDDTYLLDAGDVVIETGGGNDFAFAQASLVTPTMIDNVTLGKSAGNAWIGASAVDNHFVGNDGANFIQGGDGADTLEGGRGDDTLQGGTGNDRLDGGRGTDLMEGGSGNDVYVASGVRDQIVELAGGGIDLVEVEAARFVLSGEVENALVTRAGGSIVTGNALANRIDGGAGNDTFTGGGGADRFVFDETGNVDQILDFVSGVDEIVVDDAVLAGPITFDAAQSAVLVSGEVFVKLPGATGFDLVGDLVII